MFQIIRPDTAGFVGKVDTLSFLVAAVFGAQISVFVSHNTVDIEVLIAFLFAERLQLFVEGTDVGVAQVVIFMTFEDRSHRLKIYQRPVGFRLELPDKIACAFHRAVCPVIPDVIHAEHDKDLFRSRQLDTVLDELNTSLIIRVDGVLSVDIPERALKAQTARAEKLCAAESLGVFVAVVIELEGDAVADKYRVVESFGVNGSLDIVVAEL